ncbi:MAG: hypothetical protein JW821_09145 [Deltaproteobacteria bacterium]|nr:hypothetical protein [Deltaproteobacteria bacterium]
MREMKKAVRDMAKGLVALGNEIDRMEKRIAKLEARKSTTPRKRGRPKASTTKKQMRKKPRKETAKDAVYAAVAKSRKGIGMSALKEKTGFADRKIWGIIQRLKKEGKIASPSRGMYAKV